MLSYGCGDRLSMTTMDVNEAIELLPCWICLQPCQGGLCATCYANPDPDVEIEIESEDGDDTANTDTT